VSHPTTARSGCAKWRISSQRISGTRWNISSRNSRTAGLPTTRDPQGSLPNDASKITPSVIMARIPSRSCPFHTVLNRSTNASPSNAMLRLLWSTGSVADLDHRRHAPRAGRGRPRQGHRLRPDGGLAGARLHAYRVERRGRRRREILPVVRATTLGARQRAGRDQARDDRLVIEIDPVLPRQIE